MEYRHRPKRTKLPPFYFLEVCAILFPIQLEMVLIKNFKYFLCASIYILNFSDRDINGAIDWLYCEDEF
jgi:hypothetical protein